MQRRYPWRTREDWYNGYQAFAELEEMLMNGCLQQLLESNNRLYRLLDTALNGTQYSAAGDVITPAIPAVPPDSATATNAMRAHISRMWQLLENDIAGVTAGPNESIVGAPALPDDGTARQLLRRLAVGLDGNGTPAPDDNLLTALRGTAQADTDRNVIDKIAELDLLLAEIRDLLI